MLQPARLRDPGWPERLADYTPDVAVVVAFGQILPRDPARACPARVDQRPCFALAPLSRRGADRLGRDQGERETGITTFQMDAGMDTGPILLRRATPIGSDETAGELAERLAALGAAMLVETLDRLEHARPAAAGDAEATRAPRLRRGGWPARLDASGRDPRSRESGG